MGQPQPQQQQPPPPPPLLVEPVVVPGKRLRLGWIFLIGSLVVSLTVPFGVAKICFGVESSPKKTFTVDSADSTEDETKQQLSVIIHTPTPSPIQNAFPTPVLDVKKKVLKAVYTSKCFDDLKQEDKKENIWSQNQINVHLDFRDSHIISKNNNNNTDDDDEEEDDENENDGPYQPAGQHLLLDIRNVNTEFLNNAQALARNMVDIITQSKLTLLSYHCHNLVAPMGVSCVGVLLESHFSFHTWPSAGAISLDLFTCGSGNLLPLIPVMEKLFAMPRREDDPNSPPPALSWSYKMRGYSNYYSAQGDLVNRLSPPPVSASSDSERDLLGWVGFGEKHTILVEETDFQQVEVYETFQGGHQYDSQSSTGSHGHTHDKRIYLDGVLQSSRNGLAAYHEALVHPAMVANGRLQQRVAIIGGGEGTTLREVLKHKTVTTCTMIEIDGEFVDMARTYLSEWNDCSDFVLDGVYNHTSGSCFDDPRTELYLEDALAWFVDRYGNGKEVKEEDKYDVIIMDALDPSTLVEFCHMMYGDERFVGSLVNALEQKQGVLVMQVGEHTYQSDLVQKSTRSSKILAKFEKLLEANGMHAMKSYVEAHGLFSGPWEFRISFMEDSLPNFFRDAALVDWELARRTITTKSGQSPFQYFDGATMASYQYPSRIEEDFFCQTRYEDSEFCDRPRGFNTDYPVLSASALEVKPSTYPIAGSGVFFKEEVQAGSYFTLEQNVHSMTVMHEALRTANETSKFVKSKHFPNPLDGLFSYTQTYGHDSFFYGDLVPRVCTALGIFINDGCNGSYVLGAKTLIRKTTANSGKSTNFSVPDVRKAAFYEPCLDRNHFMYEAEEVVLTNVKAGNEALSNYLDYFRVDNWTGHVFELKAECLERKCESIPLCKANLNSTTLVNQSCYASQNNIPILSQSGIQLKEASCCDIC